MEYLATFHTHFDALKYHKYIKGLGQKALMKPVPRKLSSSCGSCVVFTLPPHLSVDDIDTKDMESLYLVEENNYKLIIDNE